STVSGHVYPPALRMSTGSGPVCPPALRMSTGSGSVYPPALRMIPLHRPRLHASFDTTSDYSRH
ncbi:hypothetical protein P4D92_005137, partial [Escherichia coli]